MRIQISFIIFITAIIDYILWTMGKVPYGALCWVIPLILGIIWMVIEEMTN